MKTRMASGARPFLLRLALAVVIVLIFTLISRAGGPKCVAGNSFFDPTAAGKPLLWPSGQITYYTDQGDLSPILANSPANDLVADAFRQWTSVPTAALTATRGGPLAEDVSGLNVTVNADRTISLPPDVQDAATATPVGVVYDSDGAVTDALIGDGAGDPSQCFANAAFGGNDSYGPLSTYQHALIVINGQCAQQSSQLVEVEYRLVRLIGNVLGVGWSQVNPNVLTGKPPATVNDLAGFPVMHQSDPVSCVPITRCYPSPYLLTMDDAAAISRLYPVTAQNQSNFPGKQIFSTVTARIHGTVWFTDSSGNRTQPMQGVNVVARWIDPTNGVPSRRYATSSVSGFLFTGNAGNAVTGLNDVVGDPYSEWGSTDSALEGFFDLAGLQLPKGGTAQYELTVEPIDPLWASETGPYASYPVTPSGTVAPIIVSVRAGQDAQQDILMLGSAQPVASWSVSDTWTDPAQIPPAGDWVGSLSGYGDVDYFQLSARANRTLSIAVTALDETGRATGGKAQPVIGMWSAGDPPGTSPPALTASPFNSQTPGMTRLDAQVATSSGFLIGISDLRGDGRPDYHYHAHILYADSVSPPRLGVNGGSITVRGTGFAPGLTASAGGFAAPILATAAGQLILAAPAHADGPQSITISDPVTGASTTMTGELTYGAAENDNLVLTGGGLNSPTPVGTQATTPLSVRVVSADGVTPVSGATVGWSANKGVQLSACGGAPACSSITDESGNTSTWLTPATTGAATITATLAPGIYASAKSVSATLNGTMSASDIGVLTPYLWVAEDATVSIPLNARVLSNGTPQKNANVKFTIVKGVGTLSPANAQTNASGYATVSLSLAQFADFVQVSACVAPANAPCQKFSVNPVPASMQSLQPVSGGAQVSAGQAFQPVVVRVTDNSSPPNPVLAATVTFQSTVLRPGGTPPSIGDGETNPTNPAMPVILGVNQSSVVSDVNGLASIVPSDGGFSAPLVVDVAVTAGTNASLNYPLVVTRAADQTSASTKGRSSRLPVRLRVPVRIEQ